MGVTVQVAARGISGGVGLWIAQGTHTAHAAILILIFGARTRLAREPPRETGSFASNTLRPA